MLFDLFMNWQVMLKCLSSGNKAVSRNRVIIKFNTYLFKIYSVENVFNSEPNIENTVEAFGFAFKLFINENKFRSFENSNGNGECQFALQESRDEQFNHGVHMCNENFSRTVYATSITTIVLAASTTL